MSRRTKLIILAVFLVLLGISAVHVAMTWAPVKPLKFQIEKISTAGRQSHLDNVVIHVCIKNACAAPVYHIYATMASTLPTTSFAGTYAGTLYAEDLGSSPHAVPAANVEVLIPAHGEVLVSGHLIPQMVEAAQRGELEVVYTAETTLHRRVFLALLPVKERLPEWMQVWLPKPAGKSIVPLEAAIDGPPASAADSSATGGPAS